MVLHNMLLGMRMTQSDVFSIVVMKGVLQVLQPMARYLLGVS